MGIKGLTSLLKQNSNSIETTKLYTLSGKKVAIDASVFIYQSLIVNRYNNDYLRNDNNKIISHISGIFYKTINYLSLNITPIYIFDGKPPIEKFNTIHNRNIKAKKAKYLMDNSTDIKEKQNAIKELSVKTEWCQQFSALTSLINTDTSTKDLLNWLRDYERIVHPSIKYWLWIFPMISLLSICMAYLSIIPNSMVAIWFFVGLGCVGYYLKKTNKLVNEISKFENGIKEYAVLLDLLEKTNFKSNKLEEIKLSIKSENKTASIMTKKLYQIINLLNNRQNFIIGIAGNGFALWDLQYILKFEKWMTFHLKDIKNWFNAVHEIDAMIGMGTYTFNYSYKFPEINKYKEGIQSINLGHPLIQQNKCIRNGYGFQRDWRC